MTEIDYFCCAGMRYAMQEPDESFFHIRHGILYLTLGQFGEAALDRAVMYCPFCGRQLMGYGHLHDTPPVN